MYLSLSKFIAVCTLTVSLATPSRAARLEDTAQMSRESLNKARDLFMELSARSENGQLVGYAYQAKILDADSSETAESIIKQLVLKHFTDYSTPQYLEVERVDFGLLSSALSEAARNIKISDKAMLAEQLKVVETLLSFKQNTKLFRGIEENSFGGGRFLAIYDEDNQELLMLGSYYSE